MMTPLEESLHILKDFPPVSTKAWEAAIHVDLKGQDDDYQEGIRAFFEKRKPVFQGK
jgi:hypothetical protein